MQRTLSKSITLALSIVTLVLILDERGELVPVSKAQSPQEKTVEQVEKNIKVLTGMPQSQLVPVMNYFAASMGRRCNYCHVNNQGQWDYASDAKPEKNTAREMIKLVMDINKTTERMKVDPVSCYTCHRGRTSPQSVPVLPLPVPSPAPNAGGPRGQSGRREDPGPDGLPDGATGPAGGPA